MVRHFCNICGCRICDSQNNEDIIQRVLHDVKYNITIIIIDIDTIFTAIGRHGLLVTNKINKIKKSTDSGLV